jgi:hypothetical protein
MQAMAVEFIGKHGREVSNLTFGAGDGHVMRTNW